MDSFDPARLPGFGIDIHKHPIQLSILRCFLKPFRNGREESPDDFLFDYPDDGIKRSRHADVGLKGRASRKNPFIRCRDVRVRTDDG